MSSVFRAKIFIASLTLLTLFQGIAFSAPKKPAGDAQDTLAQYVEKLQKHPDDQALREKIIKTAMSIKPAPEVPEVAERHIARGVAFFTKASDNAGYHKAIEEFEAAVDAAPWLDKAYFNLGVAQEKAGLYKEAIKNLKLYLLADPKAKNSREVRNQIYILEVNVEESAQLAAAPAPATAAAVPDNANARPTSLLGAKPELALETDTPLKVIRLPQDKKSKMPSFAGTWFFKDVRGGEEIVIQAFEIAQNANGELTVVPPKRLANNTASVQVFEIVDKKLKLELKWKMTNVPAYWKTENYELTMSDDGKVLSGAYNQTSVGGRKVYVDKDLFRQ